MFRITSNIFRISNNYQPIASTSRSLATIVNVNSSSSSSSSSSSKTTTTSLPKLQPNRRPTNGRTKSFVKRNKFVVPSPNPLDSTRITPRYSANSSRTKGRTPRTPSKALSITNLLDPSPKTLKENQYEQSTIGQIKIYLPSVFFRLVRNTGLHEKDPYTATFRTDLRLTKPDISNYLKNIYGLNITSLRTINYMSALKRNPIGGGYSRAGTFKNYKKVLITMTEPFWYPEERNREWCNDHFQRDKMEELKDRKMLKVGDGQKYGVGAYRYRGAGKSAVEVARLAKASLIGTEGPVEGGSNSAQRLRSGLKRHGNVLRSKEEKLGAKKDKITAKMDELRQAGW